MKIKIYYNHSSPCLISIKEDPDAIVWTRIKSIVIENQGDALVSNQSIQLQWSTILNSLPSLLKLKKRKSLDIEYTIETKNQLQKFAKERESVKFAKGTQKAEFSKEEIGNELILRGFVKRTLKEFQIKDVYNLIRLSHGANFSVPGAGKTTVTLALHLLTRSSDTKLLVIAPKNAFSAWDEVITDCLNDETSEQYKFIRLIDGYKNIQQLLKSEATCFIIGYDQLRSCKALFFEFLSTNKVHMVLDESHKMKGGQNSKTGSALLQLSHLPTRKDILSGTPIPKSLSDLGSQMEFLWPGQNFSKNIQIPKIHSTINNLYIRTTKKDLHLTPTNKQFIDVPMSEPQKVLYSIARKEILKNASGILSKSNIDISKTRKSVMQMLQISSNPILLVNKKTQNDPYNFPYDDPNIESLFKSISLEKDSPKIKKACSLAREIVSNESSVNKVVIWSTFTYNVERIAYLLKDLGAVFIHGGVNTGSQFDINTREGRIKLFHDDPNCKVLIANPAACSEGISLHKVCHNAIYVDRSYNAGQFLQSLDRIHRLGLTKNIQTNVYILESIAPKNIGSIDHSVRNRTHEKLKIMDNILNDTDLKQLLLDEEEGFNSEPDIVTDDIIDIMNTLKLNN